MAFTLENLATEILAFKEYKRTRRDKPKQHQQNANTMRLLQNQSVLYQ